MKISETDKWTFHYPDIVPTAIPVTVKKLSSTQILFHFSYGNKSGKISLTLSTDSRGSFQGSYMIPNLGTNRITFTVAQQGRKLIGKPEGFHGPIQWTFTRAEIHSPQKSLSSKE